MAYAAREGTKGSRIMASINRLKKKAKDNPAPVAGIVSFFYLDSALEVETMQGLLVEQLRVLYAAENQVMDALSNGMKVPDAFSLIQGLEHQLRDIREHGRRLERVLNAVGMSSAEIASEAVECHGCNESADQFIQPRAGLGRLIT